MLGKGKIVAFEGLDCSFKETNYKNFIKRLKKEKGMECGYDKDIITESFPRYDNEISIPLNKWLTGQLNRSVLKYMPSAVNALYSIDRMDFWLNVNHNNLEHRQDYLFVFDRYILSSPIYNPISMEKTTATDVLVDPLQFCIPLPNIVVWMRMKDFDVIKSIIQDKKNKDENEKDIEFLKKAWERSEEFLFKSNICEAIGIDLIVVDCLDENNNIRSEEELADEIWDRVLPILERPLQDRTGEELLGDLTSLQDEYK